MPDDTDKVLKEIPPDLQTEYALAGKPHLQELTVSDLNNLTQALMEHVRKGGKPKGNMCCTTMCCP